MGEFADMLIDEGMRNEDEFLLSPDGFGKKKKTFIWTTRNGDRMNIINMDTSHINNCVKMLERQITHKTIKNKKMFLKEFKKILKKRLKK